MAVTSARLGKLRLNAGRLAYVAPTAPHTPTPPHQSLAGPLTVQWLGEGNGYDVYFGTAGNMPFVGHTKSRAWVLPPLTVGVIYYWQILAKANALGPQQLGPLWAFTATRPAAPIYLSPANHSVNQPSPVVLSWTQPPGAAGDIVFDVYFGPVPSRLPRVGTGQTATTFTTGALAPGVDYYWRIEARNNAGAVSGPTWTFETRNPTKGLITIGGVDVRSRVRIEGVSIRDLLADTPNTATFTIEGTAPTVGQEVRIGLASLTGDDVIFGGYIDTVEAIYEGVPENRAWRVTAQDYVYGINRRKVRTRYQQQSATAIALDLLTNWAPAGYTGTNIVAGLPVVSGGIDFTEEDLTACFARLAARIGGYWYVDYAKDVHLFLTEATAAPTPITRAARVLLDEPPIHWSTDLTQIRTRVYVEGGGSESRGVVVPGATVMPVTDGSWYSPSGGLVVSGPQRLSYTGKAGVGGGPAPGGTPLAMAGALGAGPYRYLTTTITDGAESPLSAPSPAILLPAVAGPPTALVATGIAGQVLPPTTAPTPTPVSTQVAAPATAPGITPASVQVAAPGSAPSLTNVVTQVSAPSSAPSTSGALPMSGEITTTPVYSVTYVDQPNGTMYPGGPQRNFFYRVSYTNAKGETVPGAQGGWMTPFNSTPCNAAVTVQPAPTGQGITSIKIYREVGSTYRYVGASPAGGGVFKDTQPDSALGNAPTPPTQNTTGTPGTGQLTPGTYHWRVVFVTATGATNAGPAQGYNVAGTFTAVQLSGIPTSPDGRVTARRIYRTPVNGGTYQLEATLNDNVTTTFLSQTNNLGAGLSDVNTTGTGKLAAGYTYAWLVTFGTSSGETTAGPSRSITASDTVNLTQIPTSGDGRVTRRKIYRTAAGGGAFKLEATINDNTTTTYQSGGVADGSLGASPPTTNTTGTGNLTPGSSYFWVVTYVASSPSGETEISPYGSAGIASTQDTADLTLPTSSNPRVIARRVYRTAANGGDGVYRLETTINDNTTTAYRSTKTDAQLGVAMPASNTTGTGKLTPGSYFWVVTYATSAGPAGETTSSNYGSAGFAATYDVADLTIPISPDPRVTKRKIYRTVANGGDGTYRLEATINENTSTTYRSGSVADGALGAAVPSNNTTGSGGLVPGLYYWLYRFVTSTGGETDASTPTGMWAGGGVDAAQLSGIATSPDTRVTKRRIYRTAANSGVYKLEAEINDNSTTTYTSTKPDAQLGADWIPGNTTSAGGQVNVTGIQIGGVGTTARKLYRTTSGGAAYQLVTTISDNTTTSYQDNKADGSLGAGAPIAEIIQLVGIPASGPGSVRYEIRPNDPVNIFIQCDDTAAQAALAVLESGGSQGIVEHVLQDRRLALAGATATGMADLKLFSRPIITIQYATRDPNTRSGKTVHIDLPELSLVGDFTIQTIEIDEIDLHPGLHPKYRVTCSSVRFSFEDAVRRFQLDGTE